MAPSTSGRMEALSELPAQYAALASEFRNAARQLAQSSSASDFDLIPPTSYLLRQGTISTRFYIATQGGRLVYFFVRRQAPVRVVLDASIGFRMAASDSRHQEAPLALSSVRHYVILPRFFRPSPTPLERMQIDSLLRASIADTLILQLDTGLMALAHPESVSDVGIVWQNLGVFRRVVEPSPGGRTFHLPPFLALARAIRRWVIEGFEKGEEREFSFEGLKAGPAFVLQQLASAWVEAVNHLEARHEAEGPEPPGSFAQDYVVRDYHSRVVLRLAPDGTIAEQDGEDPFQLLATLSLTEEHGVPRSRIAIGPPDFLVTGTLHDAFLESLLQDQPLQRLTGQLGLPSTGSDDVAAYLRSAWAEGALVFRVKRGRDISEAEESRAVVADKSKDRDTEMVVLHGQFQHRSLHVVLRFDCHVNSAAQPPVRLIPESVQVLYTLPQAGTEPDDAAKLDFVRYFLRLLTHLRNWYGVLR